MAPHANDPPRDKLPVAPQRMRAWATAQIKHYGISDNPVEPEEIVNNAASEADRRRDFAAVAALPTKGRVVVADSSGHHIQIDQPDLVIATIRQVLARCARQFR